MISPRPTAVIITATIATMMTARAVIVIIRIAIMTSSVKRLPQPLHRRQRQKQHLHQLRRRRQQQTRLRIRPLRNHPQPGLQKIQAPLQQQQHPQRKLALKAQQTILKRLLRPDLTAPRLIRIPMTRVLPALLSGTPPQVLLPQHQLRLRVEVSLPEAKQV